MLKVLMFSNGVFLLEKDLKVLRNVQHINEFTVDEFYEPILDTYMKAIHIFGTIMFNDFMEKYKGQPQDNSTLLKIDADLKFAINRMEERYV